MKGLKEIAGCTFSDRFESKFLPMPLIEQDQSFELSRDISPEISKGMMGVILRNSGTR